MNIKKFMTLDEAREGIKIQNPGGRTITIDSTISGDTDKQVFASADLPEELNGQFIGIEEDQKGNMHPKFVLNEVTSKKLNLHGKLGYIHGADIMDDICAALVLQKGIFVRSIKVTDNVSYPYSVSSNYDYWMASRVISDQPYHSDVHLYGLNFVTNRRLSNYYLFSSECDKNRGYGKFSVRAVVILQSILKIEDQNPFLPWFSGNDE